jgi:hypothetical protein
MPLTGKTLIGFAERNAPAMSDRALEDMARNPVPEVAAIARAEIADREADRLSDCTHPDRLVSLDDESRGTRGHCAGCNALLVDFGEGWETGWLD